MSYPYDNNYCGYCDEGFLFDSRKIVSIRNPDTKELIKVHTGDCFRKLDKIFEGN